MNALEKKDVVKKTEIFRQQGAPIKYSKNTIISHKYTVVLI